MNYELAKQLHDAHYGCNGPYDENHRCSALHCNHCGLCSSNPDDWEFPTLEELIEACGDKFIQITRDYEGDCFATYNPIENDLVAEGKTIIEAVAKLWLALSKLKNE